MPKSYKVLERSFINGQLHEAGATVVLEIDSPGSNLKALGEAKEAPLQHAATGEVVAFHVAAGRYGIKDDAGDRVGEFIGTKDEAQAEAERVNGISGDLPDA